LFSAGTLVLAGDVSDGKGGGLALEQEMEKYLTVGEQEEAGAAVPRSYENFRMRQSAAEQVIMLLELNVEVSGLS